MQTKKFVERIILIIFGIVLFQTSFSQENYLPGYIIKLNGDTLRGFIDYRYWERNPDKISFQEKQISNKVNYNPMDIKGFCVLDEIYESAIIKTEISPNNTKELKQYDEELKFEVDTTFLQTMIQGVKNLYFYKNKYGKEQFYIRQDSSFELLIYKRYLTQVKNHLDPRFSEHVINENKRYLGQLLLYFQDCPTIQTKLRDTEYKKKSMENLFQYYYNCTKSEIKFQKKTEKTSIEIGILAGISSTSLKFKGETKGYLVNAGYNQSVNLSAGLFADVSLSRHQGKWSIYNELIFTSYKVNGRFVNYLDEEKYTIYNTTIELSYLKMNNMMRFKYPIGNISVYANAGISNGFAINVTNFRKTESRFYSTTEVEIDKAIDGLRKYEQGYIVSLGSKFKKYSFEIRREWGNGMSPIRVLKSSANRFYFLLGYSF